MDHRYRGVRRRCQGVHSLANDVKLAIDPLAGTLGECGGMAGDHDETDTWTNAYDQSVDGLITTAATLVSALTTYGDVLAAMGHNWAVANNINPRPAIPAPSESPFGAMKGLPGAKGQNGEGLDTSIEGLLEHVGKIPNGDADKLLKARGRVESVFRQQLHH